jgi:hypothetical protein
MKTTRTQRRTTALALSLLLAVSACGASGGATPDKKTDPEPKVTTTTEATTTTTERATTTTSEPESSDGYLDSYELDSILPLSVEVGDGYTNQGKAASILDDRRVTDQCDSVGVLGATFTGLDPSSVSFTGTKSQGIDIAVGNSVLFDNGLVESEVGGIDGCKFEFEIESSGRTAHAKGTLEAKTDDTYGDFGAKVHMEATISDPNSDRAISVQVDGYYFVVNGVGATAMFQSGYEDDLTPIPLDQALVSTTVSEIESRMVDAT